MISPFPYLDPKIFKNFQAVTWWPGLPKQV